MGSLTTVQKDVFFKQRNTWYLTSKIIARYLVRTVYMRRLALIKNGELVLKFVNVSGNSVIKDILLEGIKKVPATATQFFSAAKILNSFEHTAAVCTCRKVNNVKE